MNNKELLEKARQAGSPEELLAAAGENGYPLDENGAKELFKRLHDSGELSDEELIALAKENDIELSEDKAKEYFERLNKSGELSDGELDNVSGGGCGDSFHCCPRCDYPLEKVGNGWRCRSCGYTYGL